MLKALLLAAVLTTAPVVAEAQQTLNHCTMAWNAPSDTGGIQGYNIYIATASGQPGTKVGSVVGAATTTWTCPAHVTPDQLDYATVSAYGTITNADGTTGPSESARSNEVAFLYDTTSPAAPTNVQTAVSGSTASITWSESSLDVQSFRVTLNGQIYSAMTTSIGVPVTGLTPGVSYPVTVAALDQAGNISTAGTGSVLVPAPPPPPPSGCPPGTKPIGKSGKCR